MIYAGYDAVTGAYIDAVVYFPSLDAAVVVPFLVDTGAASTAISVADLWSLGPEAASRIAERQSDRALTGIGGSVVPSLGHAGIAFAHVDGGQTQFRTTVALIDTPGVPSLLGRDILSRGYLHFDGMGGTVWFEIEKATFRLDIP